MKTVLIVGLVAGVGFMLYQQSKQSANDPQAENVIDATKTAIESAMGNSGPIQDMQTSQAMLNMLSNRETYASTPYQLADGAGLTWGFGHKQQSGEVAPSYISKPDAFAQFADDVVNRGEKWVKLYVNIDLTQNQFDALVSIAFNMSPQSFKKFADQVNAGNGIDDMAAQSVAWVAPQYQNGIQNRRNSEMNVFDNGVYA